MSFQNINKSNPVSVSSLSLYGANFERLAKASSARKWVLFTAQTDVPELKDLLKYQVDTHKIIQLKSSAKSNEMEVVIKAITSGNASAVIASQNFDSLAQRQLQQLALEHACDLFFSASRKPVLH